MSQTAQQIIMNLSQSGRLDTSRCTIMQCVRELLLNLALNEGGPPMMPPHHMGRPPHPGMGGPGPHPGHMGGPGGPPPQMRMMNPMMQQQQRMMFRQQQQQQQ